jgi:hypothetical protein
MRRRRFLTLPALAPLLHASASPEPGTAPETSPELDAAIDAIAPGTLKRASVILCDGNSGLPRSRSCHYQTSASANDFWPASTIKLYTAIAAMEEVHARGFPLDSHVLFEHRSDDGTWITDCARTLREMSSEVFRRSSNEDYTLNLRISGIDQLNSQFLTAERGFPHSAIMRGYVTARPWVYRRDEPQRITLIHKDRQTSWTHTWSGKSWSRDRGATVIDSDTGNCTPTAALATCLHRLFFHEALPEAQRFRISSEMADFLLHGGDGLSGLQTTAAESGPYAWDGGQSHFPHARWYHKCGIISNHALDLAAIDDRTHSGRTVFLCAMIQSGSEPLIRELCGSIIAWARRQP